MILRQCAALRFLRLLRPLRLLRITFQTCVSLRSSVLLHHRRFLHKELVAWAAKQTFSDLQTLLHKNFTLEANLEQKYPDQLVNHEPFKVAAVTMAFYESNSGGSGDIHVLMIKRASRGRHGGQIAFPGGKKDPEDASFLDTALRETFEEVGVSPSTHNLQMIGNLPPILSNQHKFYVVPYVATIFSSPTPTHPTLAIPSVPPSSSSPHPSSSPSSSPIQSHTFANFPPYTLQPTEVDHILAPTLRELSEGYFYHIPEKEIPELSMANLQLDPRANTEWQPWRGPVFILKRPYRDVLWGLSARILIEFFKKIQPQK